MKKEYVNRYWEVGEKNKYGKECYKLHFTEYYDDEIILGFVQDEVDADTYIYVSEFLNVENDVITADSAEDAKKQFEDMIIEYIEDEISRFESMLEKFKEEAIC
ncbi:MAG: hypothetical protein LUH21_04525 [Clostridiales bacterium]|nr:hypothetical protein [Clostridiales bacterium]